MNKTDKTYLAVCPLGHKKCIYKSMINQKDLLLRCPHCGIGMKFKELS